MNSLLRSNYMSSLRFKIEQIIHNTVLTPVSDFRWDPVLHLLELNFLSLRLLPIVQPLVQAQVFIIRASIPSVSPKCTGNCLLWGRELLILQRILHSMGWVRSLKYMRPKVFSTVLQIFLTFFPKWKTTPNIQNLEYPQYIYRCPQLHFYWS